MSPLITSVDRIYVAGHRGTAGSAICRALERSGYHHLLTASRAELDSLMAQQWKLGSLSINPRW